MHLLQELRELITKSSSLDGQQRAHYLSVIKYLPEKKLKKLFEIFNNEIEKVEHILKNAEAEKNKKKLEFLDDLNKNYQEALKAGMHDEESAEKENAKDILNKLE